MLVPMANMTIQDASLVTVRVHLAMDQDPQNAINATVIIIGTIPMAANHVMVPV